MGFRQNNKRKAAQDAAFAVWKERNRKRIAAAGLPPFVVATRDDWAYFVQEKVHKVGNWGTPLDYSLIDFSWYELTEEQKQVIAELEADWAEAVNREPLLAKLLPSKGRD